MAKVVVFGKAEKTEVIVRLALEDMGDYVRLKVVDEGGAFIKEIAHISSRGLSRPGCAFVDGLPFDKHGRIELYE